MRVDTTGAAPSGSDARLANIIYSAHKCTIPMDGRATEALGAARANGATFGWGCGRGPCNANWHGATGGRPDWIWGCFCVHGGSFARVSPSKAPSRSGPDRLWTQRARPPAAWGRPAGIATRRAPSDRSYTSISTDGAGPGAEGEAEAGVERSAEIGKRSYIAGTQLSVRRPRLQSVGW